MATKGYFGYGAKSFGNPLGAISGNGGTSGAGSNPPNPGPPALVWHTIASPTAGVAIGGLTIAGGALYIVDANGLVYKSVDGGSSWPETGASGAVGGGNIVTGSAGRLIAAGTGPNSHFSDDGGVTWSPTGLVANTSGTGLMASNGAGGIFCATDAGVAGNRAYSINNGFSWSLAVDAPLTGDGMVTPFTGWNGALFGFPLQIGGGGFIGSTPTGQVWSEEGDPYGLSIFAVIFVNGLWLASGFPNLLSAATLAGLNTAPQVILPLTDSGFAVAANPVGITVVADDNAGVCNALSPAGPFTLTALPGWATGEIPTGLVWDAVNSRFVIVSDAGNVSFASPP